MPKFMYTAREQTGHTKTGVMEADSADALTLLLRQQELMVLDIKKESSFLNVIRSFLPSYWRQPRSIDIEVSLNQLSLMLRSGLNLLTSLGLISEYTANRRLSKIYKEVSKDVRQGSTLRDALSQHKVFGRLVLELVNIGEQTGMLDHVLNQASKTLEKRRQLKGEFISALIYPCALVVLGIAVIVFFMVWLVPKLEKALASISAKMPAMTQQLIDASHWFQENLVLLITSVFGLVVTIGMLSLWPATRIWRDKNLLRIPLIGTICKLSLTINFTRSYRLLVQSGVPILQSIQTVSTLLPNSEVRRVLDNSYDQVTQGKELSSTLESQSCFMPLVSQMIAVGESSGNMEEVLEELSNFYENTLSTLVKRLSVLLEPAIIIVLGSLVGYVYLSFFMAIYSIQGGI